MPQYIEGDLFDDAFEQPTIIAHVCNDQGRWGSGFVVPLEKRFPDSAECYRAWHQGTLTAEQNNRIANPAGMTFERGRTQFVRVDLEVIVANMVAQTLGGKRPLYYNDLARCMDIVADFCTNQRTVCPRIICPMFGSGLAGGDWLIVEKLIEDCWERQNLDVTVYYFTKFLPDNFTPLPPYDTVELTPMQFCYVRCIRCGAVAVRTGGKEPSLNITVSAEPCYKDRCSGHLIPVTDAADVAELNSTGQSFYTTRPGLATPDTAE